MIDSTFAMPANHPTFDAALKHALLSRDREQTLKAFFLAIAATAGNPAARRAIDVAAVTRELKKLIRRVRRRSRLGRLHAANRELSQSFFLRAFEIGLSEFDSRFSYTQYATKILFQVSTKFATAQRRTEREVEAIAGSEEPLDTLSRALSPIIQIRDQLCSYEATVKQLNGLRERLRAPAQLVWVDGLGVSTAAEQLGISPRTVSVRLHRARRLLAHLSQAKYPA